MKIHHLLHNEFGTSDTSQGSLVPSTESLSNFSLQHVDSTNSLQEDTSYFQGISEKYKSSEILDKVSSKLYQRDNDNDEFSQIFISEDNINISPEASNSISSPPQLQTFFEPPFSTLTSNPRTFNTSPSVPDLLLVNSDLWSQFYRVNNEMIITKAGRCIFPLLKFHPVNLDPTINYSFIIDFVQVSTNRYRFKKGDWISIGPDKRRFFSNNSNARDGKPTVCGNPFTHPDSPQSGAYWMNFGVSFPKIKLTNRLRPSPSPPKAKRRRQCDSVINNNSSLPSGHFYLTSFHKYLPRVKMIKHTENEDQEDFFTFEETTFIAVTHYQNEAVNILKKNNNPHAKGFIKDQNDSYNSGESENSDNIESEVDENNEVDIDGISDSGEKNICSPYNPKATLSSQSSDSEHKIRRRQNIDTDNQASLYQNMRGFRAKVVKNVNYTLEKQPATHAYSSGYSINPCKFSKDNTSPKRGSNPKLDRSFSFSEVMQQDETQFQFNSKQQFQQQNNYSAPATPLSSGNIFFSTISNTLSNSNSLSCVRLEQAENEIKRLREFIRERYGVEAEREADAVVALGGKDYND